MEKYKFYSALSHCYETYGVELDEDQFETYAMSAWRKIGNKDYKMYLLKANPICDNEGGWYVCLPCNCDTIEAITLPFEDAQNITATENYYGMHSHPIEDEIELAKRMPNELYIPGKFVKYKELDDKVYFTENFPVVNILYKGLYADEDGLPMLTWREMEAIAVYCAFSHYYKSGLKTKDANEISLANVLKADWLQMCSRARLPESVSQNSMNEIISAMSSFNRSGYGRSYKPVN